LLSRLGYYSVMANKEEIIRQYLAEIGRKGGSVTSKRKAKSSKENGKLGGRPRKKNHDTPKKEDTSEHI
jgi:hypothetical protein